MWWRVFWTIVIAVILDGGLRFLKGGWDADIVRSQSSVATGVNAAMPDDDRDRPNADWALPPEPPIHRAARKGDIEQLARLVAAGADINERANLEFDNGPHLNQLTPLMVAARSIDGASVETLRWLIEHGADLQARSEGSNTAAWYAAGHGGRWDFHKTAVTPDHVERLRYLLDLGLDATECNYAGRSLVTEAAAAGDAARLQLVLERGGSAVPILTEAMKGQRLPRALRAPAAKRGAFPAYQIPIFQAATSGSGDCVRLLVAAGADPNGRDDDGHTPLMAAGSAGAVHALLEAGADLRASENGLDVLSQVLQSHELTWSQKKEVAEALLAAGIKIEGTDPRSDGRLARSAFQHNAEAVAFLLDLGANPNSSGSTGSPLHSICWQGEYEEAETNAACARIIDLLIQAGADREAVGTGGQRPLHLACGGDWGNQTAVRTLLRHGVEVDPTDAGGATPLMLAASMGELACMQLLLEAGASTGRTNHKGESALDAARAHLASWEKIVADPQAGESVFDEDFQREMAEAGFALDMAAEAEAARERHKQALENARACLRLLQQADSAERP